uniref:Uncharacterized protein n=1 Tax=Arundo donax TaxID=35708 RepID=A0A0A8Z916_ARUDO
MYICVGLSTLRVSSCQPEGIRPEKLL